MAISAWIAADPELPSEKGALGRDVPRSDLGGGLAIGGDPDVGIGGRVPVEFDPVGSEAQLPADRRVPFDDLFDREGDTLRNRGARGPIGDVGEPGVGQEVAHVARVGRRAIGLAR